jgi:hypothetical protein
MPAQLPDSGADTGVADDGSTDDAQDALGDISTSGNLMAVPVDSGASDSGGDGD